MLINPITYYSAPGLMEYFTGPELIWPGMSRKDHIIDQVCHYFGKTRKEVITKSRKRELVEVRQICCYFLRTKLKYLSIKEIGKMFGQDHTTVIHSVQVVKDLMHYDEEYRKRIDFLTNVL